MQQTPAQNFDIPLHDIKPIVDIQEYSFYYFSALVFLATLVVLAAGYLLYKWIKARNTFNIRAQHLKSIKTLDLNNTKEAAYIITSLGATFKDDSQRHSEMYANLLQRLEAYKYKKEVDAFDDEVKGYIELYKDMIDA